MTSPQSSLRFRNLDVDPNSPVRHWPAEAIEIALDRGTLIDWHRLAAEIGRSPWGEVAQTVSEIISWGDHGPIDIVMEQVLTRARQAGR